MSAKPHRQRWLGEPFPLGASWDGEGTNIAVFSENATAVELCLFDADGNEERIELPDQTTHIHHGYFPGVGPGQRYGLRVHGPWAPERGQRFNPFKLLVDPYALAIEGNVTWGPAVFGHDQDNPSEPNVEDSAPFVPRSVIVDRSFDWEDDTPPKTPLHRTVIYETPRPGPDDDSPRCGSGAAGHLRRHGQHADHRPFGEARHHRRRAAASASLHT